MEKNYGNLLLVVALFMGMLSYAQNKQEKFIKFDKSTNYALQNAKQVITKRLQLSSDNELVKTKTNSDELGFTHQKYQQFIKGVKVEFATYTVHAKNGIITTMNGELFSAENLSMTPALSKQAAFNKATAHVGAQNYVWEQKNAFDYTKPQGELVILPAIDGILRESKLAYKYDIYSESPLYRADVYVDAHTGNILFENNKIHHANTPATGASLYNGNVSFTADSFSGSYRLRQTADGNGIQTFDMNNGTSYASASEVTSSSTNFVNEKTAVQAHWGAEKTHKYYMQKHNRNSFDGNGSIIKSYVSYRSNYVNAFWNGSVMTYGDGNGTTYGPLVSLDIVGHEITHGVTERSAGLVYSYESGALNESFSDIFGESIEKFGAGTNDWLMGEQIGAGGSGGALRSMSNPNAFGDPDTYNGTNWHTGSSDNGGVHTNSGVQNFWYYILSVGKSGTNDNGDAYTVSGIGIDKAGKIAYRNLTVYLSSNSNYAAARTGAIQAAVDLYGSGSAEEIATTNAWHAVGVGAAYGGGGGSGYCTSKSTNINDEYIGRVKLNTINKASGGQFYSDYTSISTDLSKGTAYTITITPTWTGTVYSEGYAVWIDYNGDGDFTDSGELVWSKAKSKTTPVSGTFTVPSSAANGETRMRVSMKYNAIPSACETFTYGEVEDYTVNIGSGGSSCIATTLKLKFDNYPEETSWNIKTTGGTTVASGGTYASQADGSTLNINKCLPVGCYTLTVKDTYGDGMCCSYGNGSFTLTTSSGTVLASGGSFTSSITKSFCVSSSSIAFTDNNNNNNETLAAEVTLFPNPAKDMISVSLRDQKMNQYAITNMMGQIVSKGNVAEKNINISNLKNGIYFIEFSSDKKRLVKRFVKN